MVVAKTLEKESRGDYEKLLKQVSNRTVKNMGHAKPSKDILVMQKVCLSSLLLSSFFIAYKRKLPCNSLAIFRHALP